MIKVGDKVRLNKDHIKDILKQLDRIKEILHLNVPNPFAGIDLEKIYTVEEIDDDAYWLSGVDTAFLEEALIPVNVKTIKIKDIADIIKECGDSNDDGYFKIENYLYPQNYILLISGEEFEVEYNKGVYTMLDGTTIPKEIIAKEPKYKIVAVEFDGVLGKSINDPLDIDEVYIENVEILKKYQKRGGKIILFTRRKGRELSVVTRCMEAYGLMFDAINMNVPDNHNWNNSPKVSADLYIDVDAFPAKVCGIDWDFLKKELLDK